MKVKELISKLQSFDADLDVYVSDWNEEYASPVMIEPKEIRVESFEVWGRTRLTVTALLLK